MLKAERAEARATASQGIGQYADKRRHAQIRGASRAAVDRRRPQGASADAGGAGADDGGGVHAAELQLPEAWLPYVVSR